MNLLHVVSRGSLHVAFQSSRTLPENRTARPPDTSHNINGKRGGSMEGGRKNQRENDRGGWERRTTSSSHEAMTSEI